MTELAACTIVSKNYLPFARTLARSFTDLHPGGRFFVLLVDRVDGRFDPAAEAFELLEARELENLPDFPSFAFKYTILEINTAVKPFFLEHLLARFGLDKLLYFDPDILVTGELGELAAILDRSSIVLTPHLTDPVEDDRHPGELAILQAGAYNLGFLGLARGETTGRFLAWWKERVYDLCVVRIDRGLFVDQKWIDLVPGLFPGVHILTEPGYNVAYWNLHGRRVTPGGGRMADGSPLYFFHFSGIDLDDLERVSRHQDRFTLSQLGEVRELFARYRDLVMSQGYREARAWTYSYASFEDGTPIPDLARSLYHSLGRKRAPFGDPFATGDGSFFRWLNAPARRGAAGRPYVSRLLHHLYRSRPDLEVAFPDVFGRDLERFAAWLLAQGGPEYGLPEVFLEPVSPPPGGGPSPGLLPRLRRRLRSSLRRLYHSRPSRRARQLLRRTLGDEATDALRARLRPHRHPLPPAPPREPPPPGPEPPSRQAGLNITGYLRAESGMGAGVRALVRAVRERALPHTLNNLELNVVSRMEDRSFEDRADGYPYPVNLFFVNADQALLVHRHVGPQRFAGRYNVGFWLWELPSFPEEWQGSFGVFDEIWTPSSFCLRSISSASPIPVVAVPLPVEPRFEAGLGRRELGLPEDRFLFFFAFDFLSYFERKNPLALIDAFRLAFAPSDPVTLVLKTVNSDWNRQARDELRRRAAGAAVLLMDRYCSQAELHALTAAADSYVSLHRSEGYGLTLAEAMYFGKTVIATGYSGNMDFMNVANSLPVRFELRQIPKDHGPYRAGNLWAEPDIEHAAALMRRAFEDGELRRRLGARAAAEVRRELSPEAVGRKVEERLRRIAARPRRDPPGAPGPPDPPLPRT